MQAAAEQQERGRRRLQPVLVPLRNNRPLLPALGASAADRSDSNGATGATSSSLPFLAPSQEDMGRLELLHALWKACGCRQQSESASAPTQRQRRRRPPKCPACRRAQKWGQFILSRCLLRLKTAPVETCGSNSSNDDDEDKHVLRLWICKPTRYIYRSLQCVYICRKRQLLDSDKSNSRNTSMVKGVSVLNLVSSELATNKNKSNDDQSSPVWLGPIRLAEGDIVQFHSNTLVLRPHTHQPQDVLEFVVSLVPTVTTGTNAAALLPQHASSDDANVPSSSSANNNNNNNNNDRQQEEEVESTTATEAEVAKTTNHPSFTSGDVAATSVRNKLDPAASHRQLPSSPKPPPPPNALESCAARKNHGKKQDSSKFPSSPQCSVSSCSSTCSLETQSSVTKQTLDVETSPKNLSGTVVDASAMECDHDGKPGCPGLPTCDLEVGENNVPALSPMNQSTKDRVGLDLEAAATKTKSREVMEQQQQPATSLAKSEAQRPSSFQVDTKDNSHGPVETMSPGHVVVGTKEGAAVTTCDGKEVEETSTEATQRQQSTETSTLPESPLGKKQETRRQGARPPDPSSDHAGARTTSEKGKEDHAGATQQQERNFVLYFVRRGSNMSKFHIEGTANNGLAKHAEKRGAKVLPSFDKERPPWPTHLVVSETVKPESVAAALGFGSNSSGVADLQSFMGEHNIVCVNRSWASHGNRVQLPPFEEPSHARGDIYYRLRKSSGGGGGVKRSNTKADAVARRVKPRPSGRPPDRNRALSELFQKLSKLYRGCPLDDHDEWRSYTFSIISGRLRLLDFEVTNRPDCIRRLEEIKGFGKSCTEIVQDFLETGTCDRFQAFQQDKRRVALAELMKVSGIGKSEGTDMVMKQGFRGLDDVRRAVDAGKLKLTRHQYIGMMHCNDFLERMSRSEADKIFEIVKTAVTREYHAAELTIMGSYRRGKETCGDVDILITHPDYVTEIPPTALGEAVDELCAQGHIAYHLTQVAGMDPNKYETLPPNARSKLTNPYGTRKSKDEKFSCSSYMGVFRSPVVEGKYRRVDIKFYPYRERVFASLYFTGNGYFNRAMRLWGTRKFGYKLSDHGLFKRGTETRVMDDPQTERQVFDELELAWKEVTERDCFDAVHHKDDSGYTAYQLDPMSSREFHQDNGEHKTFIE